MADVTDEDLEAYEKSFELATKDLGWAQGRYESSFQNIGVVPKLVAEQFHKATERYVTNLELVVMARARHEYPRERLVEGFVQIAEGLTTS